MGKNVKRFAADEVEGLSRKQNDKAPATSEDRETLIKADIVERLKVESQNDRHPIRGKNVIAEFEGMSVATDLSRLAASAYTNKRTAQTHEGLTTVADR